VAEHPRCYGRGETIYDPWHYVPVLARKPGADSAKKLAETERRFADSTKQLAEAEHRFSDLVKKADTSILDSYVNEPPSCEQEERVESASASFAKQRFGERGGSDVKQRLRRRLLSFAKSSPKTADQNHALIGQRILQTRSSGWTRNQPGW